jgi:ketosteroid isomerase-like protein
MSDEVEVVRRLFAAVEDRDLEQILACYSDEVEIHEADVLAYGGIWRGREGAVAHAVGFMRARGRPFRVPRSVYWARAFGAMAPGRSASCFGTARSIP